MELNLSLLASSVSSKAIVLTGSARSGTTIVGRLLASCMDIEYAFEPPTLLLLMSQLGVLPEASWKLLYETYLYEEILIGSLAGRYLNTNRFDDSSAYGYMSSPEVDERTHGVFRKFHLEQQIQASSIRICYKLPDLLPRLGQLQALYPETTFIVMRRQAIPTIRSLLHKGWFEAGPAGESSSRIYPYKIIPKKAGDQCHVPYWVENDDQEWWLEASADKRSLYYYILNTPIASDRFLVIDYEQMLLDPRAAFARLSNRLNLQKGSLTENILDSITTQDSTEKDKLTSRYALDLDKLLECLPEALQARAMELDL